ncbi:MAG: hypothetical protein JWL69_4547, partial [Phycisphaerales bacterium]|nr:hypothetical protein [Phycisphaerales bacterium]
PLDRIAPADADKYCYGVRNHLTWIRMEGGPLLTRFFRLFHVCGSRTKMVLTGRAPFKVLRWMLWGLVYKPPVEQV